MAKKKSVSSRDLIGDIGERKLNPALIDPALSVLRAMYLGTAWPLELIQSVHDGKPLPIGSLLLDPKLKYKLSDALGPVTLPILQKMIEDSSTASNRVAEVTNQIFEMQHRMADHAFKTPDLPMEPSLDITPVKPPHIPPPFSGKYLDAASQKIFIDASVEQERRKAEQDKSTELGYTLPKGADAFQTAQTMMQLVGHGALAAKMMTPGMTYQNVLDHPEFKRKQAEYDQAILDDARKLKNDPVAQQYAKDFPVAEAAIVGMFSGFAPMAAYIPARELATIAHVAASSPAVAHEAYNIATMQPGADWTKFRDAANAAITRSIIDGQFPKARTIPSIATMAVATSPLFWEAAGLKYPGQNVVWDTMKGVGAAARNYRQTAQDGFLKRFITFFEDKDLMRYEQMREKVVGYMDQYFGKESATEMTNQFGENFDKRVGGLLQGGKDREKFAFEIRQHIEDMVRARMGHLTSDEKAAAIIKLQEDGKGFGWANAPESVKAAMNSPFVNDAVDFMRETLGQAAKMDHVPSNSAYFPAWQTRANSRAELAAAYLRRGYIEARDTVDKVVPNYGAPWETIGQLIDRAAAPMFNSVMRNSGKTAETAAAIGMKMINEKIQDPAYAYKMITRMAGDIPIQKATPLSRSISNTMSSYLLTSRAGAWISRNVLDDGFRGMLNIYDNAKSGMWPTWKSLRTAFNDAPPPELFDQTLSTGLFNDMLGPGQGFLQKIASVNKAMFGVAARAQNLALSSAYKYNLASGMGENEALETAKDYMLARRVNSAFTSNAGTKLLATYANYYMQGTKFMIRELGRSPEVFVAGGALLNDLHQQNKDLSEFDREGVRVNGRVLQLPKSLTAYPLFKMFNQLNFGGDKNTREAKLEQDWRSVQEIKDPVVRMQVLNHNPELKHYGNVGTMKAIMDTVQAAQDYRAVPLGFGANIVERALNITDKYTQGVLPFGKELSDIAKYTGLPFLDVEGNLIPSLGAYRSEAFDTDKAVESLMIQHRGGLAPDKSLTQQAVENVKKKIADNLIWNRTVGLGKSLDPTLIKFQNDLSNLFDAPHLVSAPPEAVQKLQEKYGVSENAAQIIWKYSDPTNLDFMQKVDKWKQITLQGAPDLEEYKTTLGVKKEKMDQMWELLNLKDHLDMASRVPQDNIAALKETDALPRAFIESYGGGELGKMLFEWQKLSPSEKQNSLAKSPEGQAIIKEFFPHDYELFRANIDGHGLVTTPQYAERSWIGEKTKPMFDALKGLGVNNKFGIPATLSNILNASEDIPAAIDTVKKKGLEFLNKAGDFILKPFETEAGAEPLLFGDEAKKKKFTEGTDPAHRFAAEEGDRIINEFIQMPMRDQADYKKRQDFWNDRVFKATDPLVGQYMESAYNDQWRRMGGQGGTLPLTTQDIAGRLVSFARAERFNTWSANINNAMYDSASKPEDFKTLLDQGQQDYLGRTFQEYLEKDGRGRAKVRVLQKLSQGYVPGLGAAKSPNFDLDQPGQLPLFNTFVDISYRKPTENIQQYHTRILDQIKPENMSGPVFDDMQKSLKDHGYSEAADKIKLNREGYAVKLPLDQRTQDQIHALQDQLPFIENDPAVMMQELRKDPSLLETIRGYEPRLYRGFETKIWGDLDTNWKSYLHSTGYSPEAIDYYHRMAPQSYSRNFYKDDNLRAISHSLGFSDPQPTAEVAIQRQDGSTIKVPSLFMPNVSAPVPTPDGVFSSLPATLQYLQQKSNRDANILIKAHELGATLTPSEQHYIDASPTERVFMALPGTIAQGFRDGKLGPDDVIKNLSGFNKFATVTGLVSPERGSAFENFLSESSTVVGATQFGANLGKFLDDTFNVPRIPFKSSLADFALFGQPTSTLSTVDPRNKFNMPILPAVYTSAIPRFDNVGVNNIPAPTAQKEAGLGTAAAASGAVAGTSAGIAALAPAASGFPAIGAVFGVISAGFTIANILQSGSRRRAASAAARAAEEARQREIELARSEAAAQNAQQEQRQLANIRFQRFQTESQDRATDFARRSRDILTNPAPIASLALQPQDFVNTFIDKFQAKALEFIRRPTFSSSVGLISQVEGGLPSARF